MSRIYPFIPMHLFTTKGVDWSPEILHGLQENLSNPDWSIISCFSKRLEGVFACKRVSSLTAECLALPCPEFSALSFHRGALLARDYWTEKLKYRRLQATVKVGQKKEGDWLVSLGFSPEGILKGYDPDGGDHVMYGRVV